MNYQHHKNICVFLFQREMCKPDFLGIFFTAMGRGEDHTMVGGQGSQALGGHLSPSHHPHPPSGDRKFLSLLTLENQALSMDNTQSCCPALIRG